MTHGLNERTLHGLHFAADMKAVSYIHLAQYFAPNYEPAIEEPCPQRNQAQSAPGSAKERGGNLRNAPWPKDRRKRIHAVTRIEDKWVAMGLACKERPWLDRPMWVWVNRAGLRRLGLDYNDASFPERDEELNHLYQITRVRLELARRPQDPERSWFRHTWISERAIKSTYPQNTPGIVLPHLPDGALELDEDALVKMADGEKLPFKRWDRIAVEIERRRKDFSRLNVILPDLLMHYSGVWYFCQPKAASAVLATKLNLVEAGKLTKAQARLIRVLDLEEEE
jgi:hypothetical protein